MFAKLSVWISASVLATTLTFGSAVEANTLSKVSTHIIPNRGAEACVVHNSNNVAVLATVSVFPMGTAAFGIDNWTFPLVLGAFDSAKVFSWTPPMHAGSCKVLSVQ